MHVPERYEMYFLSILMTRQAVDNLEKRQSWGWGVDRARQLLDRAVEREAAERAKLFGQDGLG